MSRIPGERVRFFAIGITKDSSEGCFRANAIETIDGRISG